MSLTRQESGDHYNTLREALAARAHESWAHWMEYLFSRCLLQGDGSMLIPESLVARWQRQMRTAYADLTEGEKQSDREEADKSVQAIYRVFRDAEPTLVPGEKVE